ncbi:uncharacterized protein RCC_01675 [Ramularia collo-cygni]|uniref:Uncharacterized protein n=1 Tax=Ramularia collo-cygni TaxID=112498 RepID=A0A2D3V2V3_9PEZI|nr:uncharacterized protein RCC_01675 [Ramularia collo-cygni]CZT15839.1 uncharacterized protein RCC_01675 [Ramularia collo-cygni]
MTAPFQTSAIVYRHVASIVLCPICYPNPPQMSQSPHLGLPQVIR